MVEKLIKAVVDFILFFLFTAAISFSLNEVFNVSFQKDLGYQFFAGIIITVFLIGLTIALIIRVISQIFK